MPEITITPIRPDQTTEARRVIYTVAHGLFHDEETVDKTIARYSVSWPLRDIDNYQQGYIENGGIFLVACMDGRIIGTGALRRLEDKIGEIKRLWFLPEYQGQGLGYQMMLRLLTVAREKGYEKVRLETSPEFQPKAFAFYRRMGFYEIPRYGNDPDDTSMELVLD